MPWQFLSFVAVLLCSTATAQQNVVHTTKGAVQGFVWDNVQTFFSIPFAQPPVHELRFKPPQPVAPWQGVKQCTMRQNICPQVNIGGLFLGSEDCLYLHVYSPAKRPANASLPVMVWLYGGGFVFGDGYEFGYYDATNLVNKRNVVVVTLNYRLGVFGYMGTRELLNESGTTGNYGVQDQQLALQWVHDNIANFGGDPSRVMLFGESAGAMSTCWHLVNPHSKGLFSRALLQSGTCDSLEFFQTLDQAHGFNHGVAKSVGCDRAHFASAGLWLACVRSLSTGLLLSAPVLNGSYPGVPISRFGKLLPFSPVIDRTDRGLMDEPVELMRQGKFNRVPTIMGSDLDEGTMFVLSVPVMFPHIKLPLTEETFRVAMNAFINATSVTSITRLYPSYKFKDQNLRAAAVLRDWIFTCPTRRALRVLADAGVPVWTYHFTYHGDWFETPMLGDYHSSELPFVWNNPWPPILHDFTPKDRQISDQYTALWTNFAATGDPNVGPAQAPVWPRFKTGLNSASDELTLLIDLPPGQLQFLLNSGECDFFDQVQ